MSELLNIPYDVCAEAYLSLWKFIREKIQDFPLKEDLTEDLFSLLRTNFNIPSLGKLNCTYERYLSLKKQSQHIRNLKNGTEFRTEKED